MLACLALLVPGAASAQAPGLANPASDGMSSKRLACIGPAIQAYIDSGEVAGLVTLFARNGRIFHQDARGLADHESGRPLAIDSLFRLASQTNPVTAATVMILLEQGRLRLNDVPLPADPYGRHVGR